MKPYCPVVANIKVSKFDPFHYIVSGSGTPKNTVVVSPKILKLALAGILLFTFSLRATTIVVITHGAEVLLGIDSKQVVKVDGKIVKVETVCKVAIQGRNSYAMVGWSGTEREPIDLDALIKSSGGSVEVANGILLPRIKAAAKAFTLDEIRRYRDRHDPILTVFFLGMNQAPFVRFLQFRMTPNMMVRSDPANVPDQMILSFQQEVQDAIPSGWEKRLDLLPLLKSLVLIGIKANPETSGEPISMVRITAAQGLQRIKSTDDPCSPKKVK